MTIRLYLDEDASARALLRALRARGVDVESAVEAGMIQREDREHLEYATAHGRVLLTFNRGDFARLHAEFAARGDIHGGIVVVVQQRHGIGDQTRRLLNLIAALSAEEMHNRIEFLSNWPDP